MSTIVTRLGKGSPLTYAEGDANFTNLNNDKVEKTDLASTVAGKGASTVGLQDAGNYFATKTVEAALQQIGVSGVTASYFIQARNTTAPNATTPAHSFSVNGAETNIDAVLSQKGTGAIAAQVADNLVSGGNKRGFNAVDWQTTRILNTQVASGANATVSGGADNTASGAYSVVIGGRSNIAGGQDSAIFGGFYNSTSGTGAICAGNYNVAAGNYSVALGQSNTASGYGGMVLGSFATDRGIYGRYSYTYGRFAVSGDIQYGRHLQYAATSNATPATLVSDGQAPSTTNVSVLPPNSAYTAIAYITARNTSTGDMASWRIDGAVKQGATAASTALVGTPAITTIAADTAASTWAVAMVANTTRGSVEIQVTGVAATNIHWVCKLDTIEVG